MNSKLLDLISDQVAFRFTGRINIISTSSAQLFGFLLIKEGRVIHAKFKDLVGDNAFISMVLFEQIEGGVKFISEPEMVEMTYDSIDCSLNELVKKSEESLVKTLELQRLRPQNNLKLRINPKFIWEGEAISQNEFDLLCVISDYSLVSDIYYYCHLIEYEITNALISLRRKKGILVFEAV